MMSASLTLWTGSEVSSTTSFVPAGRSSTWTWLSPVLPKLRMRLTVPPTGGLLPSLSTSTLALGGSSWGPMLFMISYPSSDGSSLCFSAWLGTKHNGWLFLAFVVSSVGVTTGDWWEWKGSGSGTEFYVSWKENIKTQWFRNTLNYKYLSFYITISTCQKHTCTGAILFSPAFIHSFCLYSKCPSAHLPLLMAGPLSPQSKCCPVKVPVCSSCGATVAFEPSSVPRSTRAYSSVPPYALLPVRH